KVSRRNQMSEVRSQGVSQASRQAEMQEARRFGVSVAPGCFPRPDSRNLAVVSYSQSSSVFFFLPLAFLPLSLPNPPKLNSLISNLSPPSSAKVVVCALVSFLVMES